MADLPKCLVCGKPCRSVGHHARAAHGLSARDYRDMHGIPRSAKLTSAEARSRWTEIGHQRAAAGALDAGMASMAQQAAERAARSVEAKRDLASAGRRFGGHNRLPREMIEAVVRAAEAGARPYGAVRDAGMSWTAFHAGLRRHPDLHRRYQALPVKRGRVKLTLVDEGRA